MSAYPLRVRANLDTPLSRWLWLVKWVPAIPHYVVLFFLWTAYAVLTVVAFFAILFTGRYPRAIFDFNVGVLRWHWRVAFYSCAVLGTDRYPPFSLEPDPGYPADLTMEYPARLSRGLVLVKWWLLALPHYLVVALLAGGGYAAWRSAGGPSPDDPGAAQYDGGLIGLLVLCAAVALLFSGRYPRGLFDLLLGLNRWVLRVIAYATLMTDVYPPFRLDLGGAETPAPPVPPAPPAGTDAPPQADAPLPPDRRTPAPAPGAQTPVPSPGAQASVSPPREGATVPAAPAPASRTWRAGPILAVVVGAVLVAAALAAGAGSGLVTLADHGRDATGFVRASTVRVGTTAYAVTTEEVRVHGAGRGMMRTALGEVRVAVDGGSAAVFAGIARRADVESYLGAVAHDRVTGLSHDRYGQGAVRYARVPGGAPAAAPDTQEFWAATATGTGARSFTWEAQDGDWVLVVMNADASPGVSADVTLAATMPWTRWTPAVLIAGTAILFAIGAGLIGLGVALATPRGPGAGPRDRDAGRPPAYT